MAASARPVTLTSRPSRHVPHTDTPPAQVRISVIVPAHNCPRTLRACLAGLMATGCAEAEIIVVDDASTDDTAAVAWECGARVLCSPRQSGPGGARNFGAREAAGEIVFFVDADVVLHPDMLRRVLQMFDAHPGIAAMFGSYDMRPVAPGAVSQYRNLLHHFVHQQGNSEASTFWGGCGAIRRSVFFDIGGFDEQKFPCPSIEDIELGYRLRSAGHRILLDKQLLGTHLKQWTFLSMIRTDFLRRALPWSRLMLERRMAPDDLNLRRDQRFSVVLVAVGLLCLGLSVWHAGFLLASVIAVAGVLVTNRKTYGFFRRRHGVWFAVACMPLHLVYFLCSGLGYVCARLAFQLNRRELTV